MIPVTKPFSPPIEEYKKYIDEIWERNWYTNNGPLVNQLEKDLKQYLGVSEVAFVSNGTIAIQIALKALGIHKKVITTPFSYVATTSSLVWEGCEPVFADIDSNTLNIDPLKIEELIDEDTQAILATHCFGNACEIDQIEKIAHKHGLKVIYDAAHCFGTKYKGESIFNFGDISTTSFHATKLFHTIEGGAIFSGNKELRKKVSFLRNFGHDGPEKFNGVGINGKNSEFHAAMGLCNLKYIDEIIAGRKHQSGIYLENLIFQNFKTIQIQEDTDFNHAYFPLVFNSKEIMLQVKSALEEKGVYPRRYFFPSLNSLDYLKNKNHTPISDEVASKVICLPLYHELENSEIIEICRTINSTVK